MHSQSILHVAKNYSFQRELVHVLFPWSTPINVISLKIRDQRAMTLGFDVSDNH